MSSVATSSDDERPHKPVADGKPLTVKVQEPSAESRYMSHNVVDYALFLCRGRRIPQEISSLSPNGNGQGHPNSLTRLSVLDESSMYCAPADACTIFILIVFSSYDGI